MFKNVFNTGVKDRLSEKMNQRCRESTAHSSRSTGSSSKSANKKGVNFQQDDDDDDDILIFGNDEEEEFKDPSEYAYLTEKLKEYGIEDKPLRNCDQRPPLTSYPASPPEGCDSPWLGVTDDGSQSRAIKLKNTLKDWTMPKPQVPIEHRGPMGIGEAAMEFMKFVKKEEEREGSGEAEGTHALKEDRRPIGLGGCSVISGGSLNPLTLKANPLLNVGQAEWTLIDVIADSGACETVIPANLLPNIMLQSSAAQKAGVEYEVASGKAVPNLGEKHCEIYCEGATSSMLMHFQVADIHRPLLSLSRAADQGFISHLDYYGGWLEDTTTGEVIPIKRQGNLYIMQIWVRSAPTEPNAGFSGRG